VKVVGADHLLFGCSYPVRKEWLTGGVDFINALDVSQEEKDLILGRNAQNLFKIS
jgi:predicted TIM-barrel fold metal-dependent hydrolase